jgi:predicted GIY-YIG superfamily endonuclease
MPKHYVYVLRSLRDRQFYVGLTSDVAQGLQAHNAGLVASTKLRLPFELVY